MRKIYPVGILFVAVSFWGCSPNDPTPEEPAIIDSLHYVKLPDEAPDRDGNFMFSLWQKDRIYYIRPMRYFQVDDSNKLISDKSLTSLISTTTFLAKSADENILYVVSSEYADVSAGKLITYNIATNESHILVDSSNISSVKQISNDTIIYYSYGKPLGTGYGYYAMSLSTKGKRLLLSYGSELGPSEEVNGFDFDVTKRILYVPIVRHNKPPSIARYNIDLKKLDTLPIFFADSGKKYCLWLRLNKDATKLLYNRYPENVIGTFSVDDAPLEESETGIIDLSTISKNIIELKPLNKKTICIFPQWSDDERRICFSASVIYDKVEMFYYPYSIFIIKEILH